jgi:hypothetical protein
LKRGGLVSETDWHPDLVLLERLEQSVRHHSNERLAMGGRILTWDDLLAEVRLGTPFGRDYYTSFLEGLSKEE